MQAVRQNLQDQFLRFAHCKVFIPSHMLDKYKQ